jgi:hypothetical protein
MGTLLFAWADSDYADEAKAPTVIRRLLTDSRMESVWDLLTTRNRKTGDYARPVRIAVPDTRIFGAPVYPNPTAVSQECAMALLFEMAVRFYCAGRIVTAPELREWRRRCRALAGRLRREIDELRTLGIGIEREIAAMYRLAAECEASADAPVAATVLNRASGDVRLRAYLKQLARETQRLFGETLYGTVATIASVASEKEVTADMVREAAEAVVRG